MENEIHIALAPDDNYTEHAVVCVISALENMRDENIVFHILDGGLCEASKRSLMTISEAYKNVRIDFEKIDVSIFVSYQKNSKSLIQTLFPMLLPEINFCKSLRRIIYLDSDMIIRTSLRPLWDMNFENNYVLAVEDIEAKKNSKKYLKGKDNFFNTGLMVINCDMWRRDDISLRAVKMALDNSSSSYGVASVVLNILFAGFVKYIDLKWNLQYSPIDIFAQYDNLAEYKKAIENPSVVHFVGKFKPWVLGLGYFCKYQEEYLRFHKLTLYRMENYKKWQAQDKFFSLNGILYFLFNRPLFLFSPYFWRNFLIK